MDWLFMFIELGGLLMVGAILLGIPFIVYRASKSVGSSRFNLDVLQRSIEAQSEAMAHSRQASDVQEHSIKLAEETNSLLREILTRLPPKPAEPNADK